MKKKGLLRSRSVLGRCQMELKEKMLGEIIAESSGWTAAYIIYSTDWSPSTETSSEWFRNKFSYLLARKNGKHLMHDFDEWGKASVVILRRNFPHPHCNVLHWLVSPYRDVKVKKLFSFDWLLLKIAGKSVGVVGWKGKRKTKHKFLSIDVVSENIYQEVEARWKCSDHIFLFYMK